jgi:hypothetical protein
MDAGRHGVARCTGRLLVGLLCGIAVGACDFRPSAPESRAEYFVEKLISEPQAVEELRSVARLAEGESPDSLANDLPTRTALTYLRARQRLGAKFGLHVAGTQRPAADKRVVNVVVSEGAAVLKEGAAVRFQVELQKQEDAWLVTRLRSD